MSKPGPTNATSANATSTNAPRISIVEAMRGLAAISVAVYHFCDPLTTEIPGLLHTYGWAGVDVFFVISGFAVPLSLHGRGYTVRNFPRFMARRLVRLEPPYLASIALVILAWHAVSATPWYHGPPPSYSLPQVVSHFLYLIPLTSYSWLSAVYWTLAYEFVFYITIGLSFAFLIRRRIEWTVLAAAAVFATSFLLRAVPDVRILEFGVGLLVMRLVVGEGRPLVILPWLAASVGIVFRLGGPIIGGAVLLAAGAIVLFHKRQLGRWAAYLGGISYSLYLTHGPIGTKVVNLGLRFGSGAAYDVLLIGVALCVSIAFAIGFAVLVERPAIRASRRIRVTPRAHRASEVMHTDGATSTRPFVAGRPNAIEIAE